MSKKTIILIPGFKGSTLINEKGELIWPNFWRAQINRNDQLGNDWPEIGLGNQDHFIASDVVREVRVIPKLFNVDVYRSFIHEVQKNIDSKTELRLFPYDWRQDPALISQQLAQFIEEVSTLRKGSIHLVCHSLGGIIASKALLKIGPKKIQNIFFVSVPFSGSLKSILDLMNGSSFGLNKTLLSSKVMATFSSMYHLLPQYPNAINGNLFDIETWKKFKIGYLAQQAGLSAMSCLQAQLSQTQAFYKSLESLGEEQFAQKLFFIHNESRATPESMHFTLKNYHISQGKGDGAVPVQSLKIPAYFQNYYREEASIEEAHTYSLKSAKVQSLILRKL